MAEFGTFIKHSSGIFNDKWTTLRRLEGSKASGNFRKH